jgi:CheY-like chemotaxis protein
MQANLFKKSAVLIERNSLHCKLYEDVLTANGFDVYTAKSAMDGLMKVKETKQDLAVINTEIAEESFMEKLIAKMQSERASKLMPIVGLSSYSMECKKNIAKMLDAFLTKPISIDKFMESVFLCIEHKVDGC